MSAVIRDLVVVQTRGLKLPGIARTFEGLARQARDAHWPHEDYLHEVLSAEQASRHESVIRQRLHEARFPEVKTLDTFDFTAAEGVSATQVHTLARGEWVTAPENLIFAGPIGTGKTPLAIALGVEATKQKRRVLFTRAADLVTSITRGYSPVALLLNLRVAETLEAERTEPAACGMCGDAAEASGSPDRRSRRLHYVSKNRADFSGFGRTAEDGLVGGKRRVRQRLVTTTRTPSVS
jgi:hypothetical protein